MQLDALELLPDEPAIDDWVDEVRERFEIIKSPPLLERLDEVVAERRSARLAERASLPQADPSLT